MLDPAELEELHRKLGKIWQKLHSLESKIAESSLGFVKSPRNRTIYCNRSNGCLWYEFIDKTVVPVEAEAIRGYLKDVKFEKAERRKKPVWKMHVILFGNGFYTLESAHDSNFAKCFLAAIASVSPEELRNPIVIAPSPGETDEVLFCRVFVSNLQITAPYDKDTDWKVVSRQAIENVKRANF